VPVLHLQVNDLEATNLTALFATTHCNLSAESGYPSSQDFLMVEDEEDRESDNFLCCKPVKGVIQAPNILLHDSTRDEVNTPLHTIMLRFCEQTEQI